MTIEKRPRTQRLYCTVAHSLRHPRHAKTQALPLRGKQHTHPKRCFDRTQPLIAYFTPVSGATPSCRDRSSGSPLSRQLLKTSAEYATGRTVIFSRGNCARGSNQWPVSWLPEISHRWRAVRMIDLGGCGRASLGGCGPSSDRPRCRNDIVTASNGRCGPSSRRPRPQPHSGRRGR